MKAESTTSILGGESQQTEISEAEAGGYGIGQIVGASPERSQVAESTDSIASQPEGKDGDGPSGKVLMRRISDLVSGSVVIRYEVGDGEFLL